jgi:hypothetical protein
LGDHPLKPSPTEAQILDEKYSFATNPVALTLLESSTIKPLLLPNLPKKSVKEESATGWYELHGVVKEHMFKEEMKTWNQKCN